MFDGSNESLYHADEELYTRFPIHSPCETNSNLRHVENAQRNCVHFIVGGELPNLLNQISLKFSAEMELKILISAPKLHVSRKTLLSESKS